MLVRLESDNVVKTVDVDEKWKTVMIGRARENDWVVNDPLVDQWHAKIELRRNKLVLTDLGKSGIFLLEKKIEGHTVMHPGSIYRIGRGKTRVSIEKIVHRETRKQEQFHHLEQITGEAKGKIYLIKKKPDSNFLIVGSGEHADIRISESWISREHALLEIRDEGCYISDGNQAGEPSRNGTKVAGEPVSVRKGKQLGRQLQDGQIISLAHVDLRFWDKDAVHVRSHFFLRLAIVLMTIAIVLGGYFTISSMRKSTGVHLKDAERYAAAGNFASAWDSIQMSLDARGADDFVSQRKELIRKLEMWEKTAKQWSEIRNMLLQESGQNWRKINTMFASLIYSDNENWKWNTTTAIQEMKIAQSAQNLIAAMLTAEEFIRSSNKDFGYLNRIVADLSSCYAAAQKEPKTFPALMSVSDQLLKECSLLQNDYKSVTEIMDSFNTMDDSMNAYKTILSIRSKSAGHAAERTQQKLSASSAIVQYCDDMLIPLELMSRTEVVLRQNYEAIASMEFDKFAEKLTLPTPQQFMVSKKLADRCTEMQETLKRQQLIVRQLASFQSRFETDGFSADEIPPILLRLFSEDNLEKVLSCDCLNFKQPGFQDKEATSVYDAIVGVQVFYDYLSNLDGMFDTSMFDERFRPVLFKSTELFDQLNTFLDFCYARNNSALAGDMEKIRGISSDNQLMRYVANAEDIMEKKKKLVRKLLQTALSQPDNRKGIIAGGMVCWLKDKSTIFVPDDIKEQVSENVRNLHRELVKMQERSNANETTPEARKKLEATLLEQGIPGDFLLRQPWSDKFNAQ